MKAQSSTQSVSVAAELSSIEVAAAAKLGSAMNIAVKTATNESARKPERFKAILPGIGIVDRTIWSSPMCLRGLG